MIHNLLHIAEMRLESYYSIEFIIYPQVSLSWVTYFDHYALDISFES